MIESEAHLKTWPTSPQHMGTAERLCYNRRHGARHKGHRAGAPSSDRNICVRWRWESQHSRGCDERHLQRAAICGWLQHAGCGGGRRLVADGGLRSATAGGDDLRRAATWSW
jgi:hypothetical protein